MNYGNYMRTQQEHETRESRKRPGQKFCDEVGWRVTMNDYEEIRRPDKVSFIGGSIIRTYTPVYDIWYKNRRTGEHVLVEFSGVGGIIVKRHVKVTTSPGLQFNTTMLNIDSSNYSNVMYFSCNKEAADYLIRCAKL